MVLPTANAILNFATKFFDMLTKKQFENPQKVFRVFQVFQVFQVFRVFRVFQVFQPFAQRVYSSVA